MTEGTAGRVGGRVGRRAGRNARLADRARGPAHNPCPPGQIGTETFVLCRKMNPTEKTVETSEA